MRALALGLGLWLLVPMAQAGEPAPQPSTEAPKAPREVHQARRSTQGNTQAEAPGSEESAPECSVRHRRVRTVLDGKANLNTASVELLQRLPGVGRTSAERIIERRARRPFHRIEELIRVKGFGRKRFQRIRPYLSVEGPSTLRPVWVLPREEVLAQREGHDAE